jgi:cell division protein FtsI/penicillin-binding protein 2
MQTIFTRFMLVVAFFIVWIGGIGVRLVHLQINQYETLRAKALDQRRDTVKEKQLRGTIYDRSERALAMSVKPGPCLPIRRKSKTSRRRPKISPKPSN